MRVLLVAYACEPDRGSEPGVGWNLALELAKSCDVWVITRANNRAKIEAACESLDDAPSFLYYDLPKWASFWKRGNRGVQAYYYLWQMGIRSMVSDCVSRFGIEVVHHVTFVKYWAPSGAAAADCAFVWGPVGGGERTPPGFTATMSARGRVYEMARLGAQRTAEKDPRVRNTARSADIALATTPATAERLRVLGARDVRVLGESALSSEDLAALRPAHHDENEESQLLCMGRLLGLKGFHLVIGSMAQMKAPAVLSIAGDGPERAWLRSLSEEVGGSDAVRFLGHVPRDEIVDLLKNSDVLAHPSLHDSGGWVCLEAMASGVPVVCLDWGGPGQQVTADCGIKVPVTTPAEVVAAIAAALDKLAASPELRAGMGEQGRRRVLEKYTWPVRVAALKEMYEEAVESASRSDRERST